MSDVRAIVLAAGRGTRMRGERPKVMHELCGKPMLWHVVRALADAGIEEIVVVASPELEPHVAAVAADAGRPAVRAVLQVPQLGTGHAVSVALGALPERDRATVVVVNGDMPLVDAGVIGRAIAACAGSLAMVTVRMPLPSSFGRIVRDGERVRRIVEARDATPKELAIDEMNAGLYAFDDRKIRVAVGELRDDNAQREFYLTDTIDGFVRAGHRVTPVLADDATSVLGVNDRVELAAASRALNRRLCELHMRAGVTIVDPHTTYLEPGLQLDADVTIRPNTSIGGGSRVAAQSEIGPNVRLERAVIGTHVTVADSVVVDSAIGDFAVVGPYAHVRAGSEIGTAVRIGNFVEVKTSTLGPGVKAAHLAYLGDARLGERANVGAGTITCNYDGVQKHRTTIGADAFIGSNTSLVAPVTVGERAMTGAGTVVLRDVPPGERVVGNPARPLPPR